MILGEHHIGKIEKANNRKDIKTKKEQGTGKKKEIHGQYNIQK